MLCHQCVSMSIKSFLCIMASLKQGKSMLKRRSPESSVKCGVHIVIVLNRMTIIGVYLQMFILLLSARLKMQN